MDSSVEMNLLLKQIAQTSIDGLNKVDGGSGIIGTVSDGYHTFDELYEFRKLYNAAFFNSLAKEVGKVPSGEEVIVYKSKRHSDGQLCFGSEDWFIVVAELPTGQISNHYRMKDWNLFAIVEREQAEEYDGHTPQDVMQRIEDYLKL